MYILGVVLQGSFDSARATNYSLLYFQSLHIYIIIKPQVIRKLIVLKILNPSTAEFVNYSEAFTYV